VCEDAEIKAKIDLMNKNNKFKLEPMSKFELTEETVIQEIHKDDQAVREKAFRTILKNRTFHGGILAKGSGLLKYGENGRGIRSRWYPNTLAKRLSNLNSISDRIDFIRGDGLEVLDRYSRRDDTVFFIDPPYTAGGKKAGKRLYKFFEIDHARLFEVCASLQGEFLMTYDDSDEVKALAAKHGFDTRLIPMKNTHHAKMEELVIGRNLAWMDFSR
jgi:DNA adenine methylase